MNVVIRTDASIDIGTGHVMRCLTLADVLTARGASPRFICREHEGNLCDRIEAGGFLVSRLPVLPAHQWEADATQSRAALDQAAITADLLVVDHYGLGESWEHALRPVARRILVIDDLADRRHDCDVLLDPNLHDSPASRYTGLVAKSARVFVGPQYALLRPEFDRIASRTRDEGLHRLLAFFGGADPTNEAFKLVHALRALGTRAPKAQIVLGPVNPNAEQIRRATLGSERIRVIEATNEIARLMAEADLGVGTCGGAAWERCCLGLPALVVISAANQRDDARILHSLGAVRNLGEAVAMTVERWAAEISTLQTDPGCFVEDVACS